MLTYKYNGKEVMFSVCENGIPEGALLVSSLSEGIHKFMSVYPCNNFIYSLRKRGIYAKDGTEGLDKFLTRCVRENFQMSDVRKICEFVLENGKTL